jgi:hypothetical protein
MLVSCLWVFICETFELNEFIYLADILNSLNVWQQCAALLIQYDGIYCESTYENLLLLMSTLLSSGNADRKFVVVFYYYDFIILGMCAELPRDLNTQLIEVLKRHVNDKNCIEVGCFIYLLFYYFTGSSTPFIGKFTGAG